MPIVEITMFEGRTSEQKRKLMKAVTKAFEESIGSPPELVRIMIHELPRENFGVAGEPLG